MTYDEGDLVYIAAGDFEGIIGSVSGYDRAYDRYLIETDGVVVAAKDWELEYMDDIMESEEEVHRVKVTVITPEYHNEFYTESPNPVTVSESNLLEISVVENGLQVAMKVYAPGAWSTVDMKLVETV